MIYRYFTQFFLILTLATVACASPFSKPAPVQEATLAPTIPDLTADQLKNAQYLLGAPGTFNESISLAGIPAGTTIYLEIQDLSAADGSLLALDAVKLVVK